MFKFVHWPTVHLLTTLIFTKGFYCYLRISSLLPLLLFILTLVSFFQLYQFSLLFFFQLVTVAGFPSRVTLPYIMQHFPLFLYSPSFRLYVMLPVGFTVSLCRQRHFVNYVLWLFIYLSFLSPLSPPSHLSEVLSGIDDQALEEKSSLDSFFCSCF